MRHYQLDNSGITLVIMRVALTSLTPDNDATKLVVIDTDER